MTILRRNFLQQHLRLIALVAAPASAKASEQVVSLAWLEGLNGTHKQYFDFAAHGAEAPLKRAQNFNAYVLVCPGGRCAEPRIGRSWNGAALVLDDGIWTKYHLGSHFSINESTSGSFRSSVISLQKRGVRLIACRQSIARGARTGREAAGDAGTSEILLLACCQASRPFPSRSSP